MLHTAPGVEQGQLPLLSQGGGLLLPCHEEGRSPEFLHQVPEVHQAHHLAGRGSMSREGLVQQGMQLGSAIGEGGNT